MDESKPLSRHPDFLGQAFLWLLLPTLVLFLIAPSVGDAQVVTTNITQTIGAGDLGTTVTPAGNLYNITGGTRPGGGPNLFHSFGDFSVGTDAIANFLNDSGLQTSNILGRVTELGVAHTSYIYGTIQTTNFGSANLFLVNPSGIVLGPTGSVNVGGSVSFSTAQYLRLFDGVNSANFYANPANDGLANSVLAVAPVVDFGFLSPAAYGFLTAPDPSATITVQGNALSVPQAPADAPPNSISFVGGKVVIEGGAKLLAPGGRIHLASAASPGEFVAPLFESLANATTLQVGLNNPVDLASAAAFTSYGLVSLAPGSSIDVSGTNTVWVKGGQLVLSVNDATLNTSESPAPSDTVMLSRGSSIVTSNSGAEPGADVQITVGTLQMDGASIASATTGSGRGGNISITDAQTVNLTNGAQIVSRTDGQGDGGDITVSATDTISISGFDTTGTLSGVTTPFFFDPNSGLPLVTSGVFSTVSSSGNGGNISISAPTVTIENTATLATITSGDGQGGDLALNVGTLSLGSGGFGNGALILSSSGVDLSTSLPTGTGQGGTVTVQGLLPDSAADSVTLANGTIVLALAFGPGRGGDVQIAAGTIGLDGAGTAINTWTFGEGNGGNITSDAGTLSVTNSATILAQTFGPGRGGDVGITADTLAMENFGNILSITSGDFGDGVGGNLSLNVGELTLMDSSIIQSLSTNPGSGQGGNVTVQGLPGAVDNAAESVRLTGGSRLGSEMSSGTTGDGGQISITAKSVSMDGGASIGSGMSGTGRGGNILVAVQHMELLNSATIASSTSSNDINLGPAGNITVQGLDGPGSLANLITLSGGGTIQMSAPGFGHLGNIEVNAKTLNLTGAAAISAGTSTDTGTAGDLTINADSVGISGESRISSQTFASNAGPVTITANQLTLDKGSIVTSTSSLIGGGGGGVVIDVGKVSLTNDSSIKSETSGTGRGGEIKMDVGTLTVTNSQISSASTLMNVVTDFDGTTEPPGAAGNVAITAAGSFTSDASTVATLAEANHGGDISITAHSVQLSNGTVITANSNAPLQVTKLVLDQNGQLVQEVVGDGNAGNVTITTPTLNLGNATITTSTTSSGNAGGITANIDTLTLTNAAEISSSSTGTASGNAGSVTIQGLVSPAEAVTITDSSLLTTAENTGQGGSITVNATNLTLNNATISASVKDVPAGGDPKAGVGNIALSASAMTMNDSNATAESSGSRNAGDISINSKEVPGNTFEMWHSTMSTSAALADGGNFGIYATNMVRLTDSIITSSVGNETKTNTLGGNITVDPQFVILQNGQIRANAFAGSGGAIDIIAGVFLADPASVLSVSSTLGVSGTINIQSPLQNVGGRLTPLSQQFSSAAALLAQQCAARVADGKFSTFVVAGREGLPAEPGGFLASPSLTSEFFGSSLAGRYPPTTITAVTGSFQEYDARPIQLAKYGKACR